MKVAVLGDTHFGAVFGLGKPTEDGSNTRIKDYQKSMDFCIQYCIDNNIDAFVQTGDLFEKRNPSPVDTDAADEAIRKLSAANIPTFIIMGNHDYKRFGGTYTSALLSMPAKHYSNVRILIKPEVISVTNERFERVNLLLMPFRDKRMYSGKTTKENSELYEQEVHSLFEGCNKKYPTIFVGHNFFYEGSYSEYGGSEVLIKPDTFKDFNASFMGHYHAQKDIKKSINCYYTGSMERNNFGEAKQKKYLMVFDSVTNSVEKVEIPVKELEEITLDLSRTEVEDVFQELDQALSGSDISGKIARMRITIPEKMSSIITKTEIEKKMYDLGADFVSKVMVEYKYEKLKRDTSALKESSDYKIFEKFLESQVVLPELKNKILEKAKEIME